MRAKRVDATQPAIVEALKSVGVAVEYLYEVGRGIPDLLLCVRGQTMLMECKVPGEKLNKQQVEFIARWPGIVHVVHSPEEALKCVLGEAMN